MSRSKRTGSTQKVGSGKGGAKRHWSGKSANTPTRKGRERELLERKAELRSTPAEHGPLPVDFSIIKGGLLYLSVCTNLWQPRDIEAYANAHHPTGVRSGWKLSDHRQFASGHSNPCRCERSPATHWHYLLSCCANNSPPLPRDRMHEDV